MVGQEVQRTPERENLEKQIDEMPNVEVAADARILISNVTTLRERMVQQHAVHGGDAVRSDETFRGYIKKRLGNQLMELKIIVGNIPVGASWKEGTHVMDDWLAQQPEVLKAEKDNDVAAKAYSAKRDYEGSSERSEYSGGQRYGSNKRSSGQYEDRGRQQTGRLCHAFKRGECGRGNNCRFLHEDQRGQRLEVAKKRVQSDSGDWSGQSRGSWALSADRAGGTPHKSSSRGGGRGGGDRRGYSSDSSAGYGSDIGGYGNHRDGRSSDRGSSSSNSSGRTATGWQSRAAIRRGQ